MDSLYVILVNSALPMTYFVMWSFAVFVLLSLRRSLTYVKLLFDLHCSSPDFFANAVKLVVGYMWMNPGGARKRRQSAHERFWSRWHPMILLQHRFPSLVHTDWLVNVLLQHSIVSFEQAFFFF